MPDMLSYISRVLLGALRAKIKKATDSNWLSDPSVTGLNFGRADVPHYSVNDSTDNCPHNPGAIRSHLQYQLEERRQFVPGPDPIVAALMFDLANATAITSTAEDAIPIYRAALELGFHDRQLLDRRISALEILRNRNILSGLHLESLVCAGPGVIVVLIFIVVVVKRRRRLARKKPWKQNESNR